MNMNEETAQINEIECSQLENEQITAGSSARLVRSMWIFICPTALKRIKQTANPKGPARFILVSLGQSPPNSSIDKLKPKPQIQQNKLQRRSEMKLNKIPRNQQKCV